MTSNHDEFVMQEAGLTLEQLQQAHLIIIDGVVVKDRSGEYIGQEGTKVIVRGVAQGRREDFYITLGQVTDKWRALPRWRQRQVTRRAPGLVSAIERAEEKVDKQMTKDLAQFRKMLDDNERRKNQ